MKSFKVYGSGFTTHDKYLLSKETYTDVNMFLQATNLYYSLSDSDNSYSLEKKKIKMPYLVLFFLDKPQHAKKDM